jgi:MoaA/NifB/PqqE/SkfB family radical SAM enzyme
MPNRKLRDFFYRPRAEATGVIVSESPRVPDWEKNRIKLIAKELRAAGVRAVFIAGPFSFFHATECGLPVHDLGHLIKNRRRGPLVIVPSHQFHIKARHIAKLLAAATEDGLRAEFDYHNTSFLAQMGLAFRAVAIPGAPASAASVELELHNLVLGEKSAFGPRAGVSAALPIEDDDIQAAYGVYADVKVPANFIVELNSTCNFKCFYCPFHGENTSFPHFVHPGQGREMSLADFAEVTRNIADWRSPFYAEDKTIAPFWRGEFFLAEGWQRALEIIKENGLRSYVCSNASVLTDDIVDRLLAGARLDHLSISLEADSDVLNREIRRNTKFAQIVHSITRLLDLRAKTRRDMKVALNFTIVPSNKHIIEEYVNSWADKVDYILIGPRHHLPEGAQQTVFEPWPAPMRNVLVANPTRKVPCIFLYNSMTIDCDLNLHLCSPCGSKRINIGSVKGRRIRDVQAESPLFQHVRNLHLDGTYESYPYCASCSMPLTHFAAKAEFAGHRVHAEPTSWVIYPNRAA